MYERNKMNMQTDTQKIAKIIANHMGTFLRHSLHQKLKIWFFLALCSWIMLDAHATALAIADRCFPPASPRFWTTLPAHLWPCNSPNWFKWLL